MNNNYIDEAMQPKIYKLAANVLSAHRIIDEFPFRKGDFVHEGQEKDWPESQYLKQTIIAKAETLQNYLEQALFMLRKIRNSIEDIVPGTYYLVKLNDTYMTEHNEKTGYNDFGTKDKALKFESQEKAMSALADVLWGGSDNPPTIEAVHDV